VICISPVGYWATDKNDIGSSLSLTENLMLWLCACGASYSCGLLK